MTVEHKIIADNLFYLNSRTFFKIYASNIFYISAYMKTIVDILRVVRI